MVGFEFESMGYQENLELYLNLSRRELQVLCKNNNLPANRSHTQLAKSLASFFEKKNAGPSPLKEKPISLVPDMKLKDSEFFSEDKSKDFVGVCERRKHFLESGSNKIPPCMKKKEGDCRRQSLTGNLMTISNHMDHQASKNVYSTAANAFCPDNSAPKKIGGSTSKAGNGSPGPSVAANIQQIEKETRLCSEWHIGGTFNKSKKYSGLRNHRQIILKHAASKSETHNSVPNIVPRVAKSSTKGGYLSSEEISTNETPSFQFFVMSEEGINLHVDLSSSPLEWINSLKDEMCMNLKMQDSKSRILPSHIGSLSEEADAHMNVLSFENIGRNHHNDRVERNSGCTTSTLSSDTDNCQSVAPQLDPTFVSSDSSVLTSSSIPVTMPAHLNGNQVIPSCATPLRDQKLLVFDSSTSAGDGNVFSDDLVDASSGKSNTSVPCTSMGPISDMGISSPEGTKDPEQMECPSLKVDDDLSIVETNGFGNSLASIPEENNLLKSDGTEIFLLTSDTGNLVKGNEECKVSIERGSKVGPEEVAADSDRSSNFCVHGGHQVFDCSVTEAHSDAISVDHTGNRHACNLDSSVGKVPVLIPNHELGKNSQTEEKETSECSQSQKSPVNNSKRHHSPEFHAEFHSKRHHSDVEDKSEIMVNLRSTRTSAKETIHEQVSRPRRSTRLLEGSF